LLQRAWPPSARPQRALALLLWLRPWQALRLFAPELELALLRASGFVAQVLRLSSSRISQRMQLLGPRLLLQLRPLLRPLPVPPSRRLRPLLPRAPGHASPAVVEVVAEAAVKTA